MPFRRALALLCLVPLLLPLPAIAQVNAPPATTQAPGDPQQRLIIVRPGDTLARLLDGAGVDDAEAHAALARLATIFPPGALRPGDEVALRLAPEPLSTLLEIEVEPTPGRTIRAIRQPDGSWRAEETLAPRTRFLVRAEGNVSGGLFPALTAAGVPPGLALSLIRILGHQVDFQRDLQPGDRFSILFERYRDSDGDILGHGQVLKAELLLSGRRLAIWRHRDRSGAVDWFDQDGQSLRRAFLRTPLDGARISSRFGMRSHPILGYTGMHRGIDFAAPTGTPVYAAADGVVAFAGVSGGYGRLVRLRHAGNVETRYAHLSRFGRGIAPGRRVRQGDVIGAVGSTGLSTGPHLHYETLVAGRHVNPARHIERTIRLAGADLTAFRARQRDLERTASRIGARDEIALAAE
ncbi:peptidoglycan DD-metalloendopeptidase family protein [Roseomonas sp. PWR1]|uniref:Peptidoglycan DD-metalloendopeptidase family protein n=1 Tax=Roseomonas nitratireducens TaxID=2820810 RepID=A0ABS4B050_9PROT|nr:peptidoglycan DD-metalloendopeptidase family protein [Neoroseomonas nitratireducens]MBP0466997.1 peptidoglycan DD-metalloendopeptidase family protein [Neoroseomonas nitratireducens]